VSDMDRNVIDLGAPANAPEATVILRRGHGRKTSDGSQQARTRWLGLQCAVRAAACCTRNSIVDDFGCLST
jgi:hypothetical protein